MTTNTAQYLRVWRRNGGTVSRDRTRVAARGRAFTALRKAHPDEFAALMERELRRGAR